MKIILLLISTLSLNLIYSQTEKSENKNTETVQVSTTITKNNNEEEKKTINKGGYKFYEYIAKRIVIPIDPNFVGGKTIVEFLVKKDGSVSVIKITNDLGFGISQQLTRIFEKCKKWTPGIVNGKPVDIKFSMPINIQGNQK
jgi:protein TonB